MTGKLSPLTLIPRISRTGPAAFECEPVKTSLPSDVGRTGEPDLHELYGFFFCRSRWPTGTFFLSDICPTLPARERMNHEEQQFQIPADLLLITNESESWIEKSRDPFEWHDFTEDTNLASFFRAEGGFVQVSPVPEA
jgi:hypothetical protein